jgi:drug/metabolite transporter (DMT)-like permease
MKRIAYPLFLFSLILFATFYAASRSALGHMKPVDLIWWACLCLLPAGLTLLLGGAYKHLDVNALCHGALLGGCLCVMLFALATSLEYTSATETSFSPCLQAIFAAVLARILFKQRLSLWTWAAACIAFAGMLLMIGVQVHASAWRGDLAAILGAFCYTVYIFLVDAFLIQTAMKRGGVLATVSVQFLTLALGAGIVELLFGNWPLAQLRLPNDSYIVLYISFIIIISTLISAFMQRFLDAVTVSFLSVLEPIFGSVIAFFFLGEAFSFTTYIGGGLVIASVLCQSLIDYSVVRKRSLVDAKDTPSQEALQPWTLRLTEQ